MFIVATYDEEGTPNAMNAAWAGACARREVALNIGSHKTTQNIVAKGAFTVSPATADLVVESDYFGWATGSEVNKAENYTALVDHAGTTVLAPGVVVKGIESWHDDQQGALRGPNRIYILEADGLRIAHLGDLGAWDDALAERLTGLDILLIPVGGYYTIDAQSAAALCHRVQPRMIIPMHYRTQANADWPIAPVEDFLSAMDAQDAPRMPLLRVTAKDLSEQPRVAVLTEG